MNIDAFDAIALLNEAQNMDELCRIYERLMCKYGFDLFALQFTPNQFRAVQQKPIAVATYDPKWVDYYFEENYHLIDPVISVGTKSRRPFLWSDGWRGIDLSERQKKFFSEAHDYGVGVGIGIPIFSPYLINGMVSLVSSVVDQDEIEKIVGENALALQLMANHFQQKAEFFSSQDPKGFSDISLTDRERECLTWAAFGKTNREIGDILGISHRTVDHHMANSMAKLEATTREYAIVKALVTKVITL